MPCIVRYDSATPSCPSGEREPSSSQSGPGRQRRHLPSLKVDLILVVVDPVALRQRDDRLPAINERLELVQHPAVAPVSGAVILRAGRRRRVDDLVIGQRIPAHLANDCFRDLDGLGADDSYGDISIVAIGP
jgi:hypothetical protein